MNEKKPLTPKQRRFALAYAECFNASEAARRAGYSVRNADVVGGRLLRNVAIRAFVDETLREAERATGLTIALLERELVHQVTFDPATMYDAEGRLLAIKDMPEATRRALAGFDEDDLFELVETGVGPRGGVQRERLQVGVTRKVRWHNKVDAIRLGLQRRGALSEREEDAPRHNVTITFNLKRPTTGEAPAQTQEE